METTQVFVSWQMDKLWYLHAIEYYSGAQRNKFLILATPGINLKSVTLSKRSQKHPMWFHLYDFLKSQNCRHRNQIISRQELEVGGG